MSQTSASQYDVIVLGAGIIGVCTALHLQLRGKSVCLVDIQPPGEGTSYGNAGLIERSSVIPYSFPRNFKTVLNYACNNQTAVRYDWSYLPKIAPWLYRFWKQSAPDKLEKSTSALLPLIERCVVEHNTLAELTGASSFIEPKGWLEVYHDKGQLERAKIEAQNLAPYHLQYDILSPRELVTRIPNINEKMAGAIHWLDPETVNDPGGLTTAYANYFIKKAGVFIKCDAFNIKYNQASWSLEYQDQDINSQQIVVAMGAKSPDLLKKLGYASIPFAVKRGYHRHYEPHTSNIILKHSICDPVNGFVLAPMKQGIRLTTGIEFAEPDAPARTIQIERAEKIARQIFPLGDAIENLPWLGHRPCLSDMLPVMGAGYRHKGLWFNFGHAHHGLTLSAVSGRLLAEMIDNQTPFADTTPFRLERFYNM